MHKPGFKAPGGRTHYVPARSSESMKWRASAAEDKSRLTPGAAGQLESGVIQAMPQALGAAAAKVERTSERTVDDGISISRPALDIRLFYATQKDGDFAIRGNQAEFPVRKLLEFVARWRS